ncbi:Laminin subunit beta-1 [Bienertia sinuspersici]
MVLEKQLLDLEEQKETIMFYLDSLRSAQIEVENERAKLKVAEARKNELELDLSLKRDLLQDLQDDEFEETSDLVKVKEKESVEAKLEIQHLMSEQKSLQLILQERDSELVTAKKRLEEVNGEVAELKMLLNKKEDQLILATGMLKEKDDNAEAMQYELDDSKLKASEAESVVGRIVDLTKELVISTKDENLYTANDLDKFPLQLLKKPAEDYTWQKKQLEAELELAKENLRAKEMELLSAHRQLAIKNEELEMIFQRLEEKDRELKALKESLKASAEQKSVDDLAVEKLQLEAAELEVEAATSALHNLAEMSRELLVKASLSIDADLDVNVSQQNGFSPKSCTGEEHVSLQNGFDPESNLVDNKECLTEIKSEVTRLSALTERLVQEAGVVSSET